MKSRAETKAWAEQFVAHLVQVAGVRINDERVMAEFFPCVGRNGEAAPDDRYLYKYAVHADVPNAQHPDAVRRVRDTLKNEGLTIVEYRETPDGAPNSLVQAQHPESRYVAEATSTAGDGRMAFSISTPCLKPPPGDSP
ncbi:hypothetical protein ACWEQL_32515 [Kitasatospora sp. NPDC004240]